MVASCGDDEVLRNELLSLLEAHEGAGEYFEGLIRNVVGPARIRLVGGIPRAAHDPELEARLRTALAPRYRIVRELGGGGMSRVFVAEEIKLRRTVVLKVLPAETVPTRHAGRFQREIEVAARLQHPHIVPLLDADTVDGRSYYTMPFVAGDSLRDRLARGGPLPVDDAVRIWRDVLDALAEAHAAGVVHRDIKPGNILIRGRNAFVTDFGIALALASAGSFGGRASEVVSGTPAYMAPEQAAGDPRADHRVDLYQAGLVLFEMLADARSLSPDAKHGLLAAGAARVADPTFRPDLPDALRGLLSRCLAKDPEGRPPSAESVLAELEAPPSAPSGATDRWARRALGVVGLAALLALALGPRRDPPPSTSAPDVPPGGHTPDIAAYEWYARGMDVALMRTPAGRSQAMEFFRRAIAIDSTYARAHAGLARAYAHEWHASPTLERARWLAPARQAAARALDLDPGDPEALAAMGWVRLAMSEYRAAETVLVRAIAVDPRAYRAHEGLARAYMMLGRTEAQLEAARRGLEVDPFSHSALRELALALATNHRCDEAIALVRPLKTLTPPASVAGVLLGQCHAAGGSWSDAITEFQWADSLAAASALAFLGFALAREGRADEARAILDDLVSGREGSHGAFGIATVLTGLRRYDEAFAWLERAVDEGAMTPYVMHPMFADLHRDARFQGLWLRTVDGGGP